ncbi:MAG: hypothetical protein AB7T49_11130 [Oligoflexales bacterium]
MILKRVSAICLVLNVSLLGCKAQRSAIRSADAAGCSVNIPGENVDPIARAAQKSCNTNIEQMFYDAGCQTMGRTFVAEKDINKARLVDAFQCSDPQGFNMDHNTVFFSHPNELLAFDQNSQVFNYYKLENGVYNFKGNSFSKDNPCLECHVNGGMIMKELVIPWPHWGPDFATEENVHVYGQDILGNMREPIPPVDMEKFTRQSIEMVTKTYVRKIKNAEAPFANATLRDVLRPLFCDAEVTLEDGIELAPSGDGALISTKNRMFMPDQRLIAEGNAFGISNDVLPELPGANEEEAFGKKKGLTRVLGLIVTKSASDLGYIDALKADGMISEELILSSRMTDYTNPIHSIRRCSVLKHVPETKFTDLKTAQNVDKELLGKLASDSDPVVKEFVGYLSGNIKNTKDTKTKFFDRVKKYLEKCNKPDSAIKDMEKLYALYRARLIPYLQDKVPLKYSKKSRIIEHFPKSVNSPSSISGEAQKLVDGIYASQEGLGLTEECQLNMSIL